MRRSGSASRSVRLRKPHNRSVGSRSSGVRLSRACDKPPMTELTDDRTQCVAGRREPILGSLPAVAFATIDDPVMFQFAQPADQYGPGDQWYPALDVVERADIGH